MYNKSEANTPPKKGQEQATEKSSGFASTSHFKEGIYPLLPDILRKTTGLFDGRRVKDIVLFSMFHVLSACMPNVFGLYHGKRLQANLYGIIGGPAGSGKGTMEFAKMLVQPIHTKIIAENKEREERYEIEMNAWNENKSGPRPEKPKFLLFFIPANTTSAAMVKVLEPSKYAVIVETEVDTLTVMFDNKTHGQTSDILRRLYHHETYSYYRKTDNEYVELINNCLSMLMTGTPDQLKKLLKSPENGMLSRIGFYVYDDKVSFINPFGKQNRELETVFKEFSTEVSDRFFQLLKGPEKEFQFTPEQELRFTDKFIPIVEDYHDNAGSDAVSIAMRLGVIFFRLAMILTVLRDSSRDTFICSDVDYGIAERLVDTLAEHAVTVLSSLPTEAELIKGAGTSPEKLLAQIPDSTFEAKWLREGLMKQGVSKRTVWRLIKQMVGKGYIRHARTGWYEKVEQTNNSTN